MGSAFSGFEVKVYNGSHVINERRQPEPHRCDARVEDLCRVLVGPWARWTADAPVAFANLRACYASQAGHEPTMPFVYPRPPRELSSGGGDGGSGGGDGRSSSSSSSSSGVPQQQQQQKDQKPLGEHEPQRQQDGSSSNSSGGKWWWRRQPRAVGASGAPP